MNIFYGLTTLGAFRPILDRSVKLQAGTPSASFWMDIRYLPAYFTCMKQYTYKEMRNNLQQRSKEFEQEDAS
jgi:hypothetical protein